METKKWYTSKTMWVNAVALVALTLQNIGGTEVIDPEAQVGIVAVVNMVLRVVTKSGLS